MFGVVVLIVVLVVALPVMFLVSGGVVAAVIGALLKSNGERTHEGSELVDTNL